MANDIIDLTEDSKIIQDEALQNFSFENVSVDDYCKRVMGLTRLCQKYSNNLQGWHHYNDYRGVQLTMNKINYHLNSLITRIFNHQDIKIDISGCKLSNQFEVLREGNDALLEKVNSDLDEACGIRRNIEVEMFDATVRTIRGPVNQTSGREVVLLASRNVQKPQLFFLEKICNSPKEPFIPLTKEKPNSMKPLAIILCEDEDGHEYYSHPYEYELQNWTPHESLLVKTIPAKPQHQEETPFLMVETENQLQEMLNDLKKSKEFAVDLEHHQFRSYQGLTSLMQISTREKDYIVDPFPLREKLQCLNIVFTDPIITKVFHGADADVLWLQRDFGIYVVNMFDTHQASVVLNYPHRSLAALLQKFCSVNANKTYQRADWRIRPLPEDFIAYARQDSHHLLYIYDELRNELIEKGNDLNNLLIATYNRGTEICLKRYEKKFVGPDTYLDLYRRSRKHFNSRQLYALQQLFLWRDKVAREQDESVEYVLPKHMMLQIAEILPKEIQGILACCNPIPLLIKTEQLTLHQIVRSAREQPLTEVVTNLNDLNQPSNALLEDMTTSSLISRHDLSQVEEKTSGMSTLLNPQETLLGDLFNEEPINAKLKKKSILFGILRASKNKFLNQITEEFKSPFERYKTYLEMKPNLEENNENEKPEELDADSERVNRIREHFLSLTRSYQSTENTPAQAQNSIESTSDSDLLRMQRLQAHIASLVNEKSLKPTDTDSSDLDDEITKPAVRRKTNAKIRMNEQLKADYDAKQVIKKKMDIKKKKKKTVKTDVPDLDEITKKLKDIRKSFDETCFSMTEETTKKVKPVKRKSSEVLGSMKKLKTNEEHFAEREEPPAISDKEAIIATEDVTPYDYSTADFNMFKNKKSFKANKNKQKLKEKFRAKGSTKATGKKKSGLKSMSWLSKKT